MLSYYIYIENEKFSIILLTFRTTLIRINIFKYEFEIIVNMDDYQEIKIGDYEDDVNILYLKENYAGKGDRSK